MAILEEATVEVTKTMLSAWENFYVIVGSSGAALTGLQFVVIALVAESRRKSTSREISAFGTPTIVHFCAVLLLAAILSAPWQSLLNASLVLGSVGLVGLIYCFIVLRRARGQTGYTPVFEDWLWHAVLPVIAYGSVLVSAVLFTDHAQRVLFITGSAALLLLFIGIHNAWDTVTFLAVKEDKESQGSPKKH